MAAVVLELSDLLDESTGEALVTAAPPPSARPHRVDIDLRLLQSWTQEGAALVRCREICDDLPDGLHYRTGRGPGRAALLAAYASSRLVGLTG
jgi:hypothetical protein